MKFLHLASSAILLATVAPTSNAQTTGQSAAPAATQQPRKAYQAGEFYLPSSRIFVHVDKTGFGHEHAVVGQIQRGFILLGASQDAGEIVFDMNSFEADTDAARKYLGLEGTTSASTQREVTANMIGPDVLNVAQFPTAVFKVDAALPHDKTSKRGLPQYELRGEFTLHGVKRPLKFLVEVQPANGWQRIRGGFAINQTDFGITPFSKAFGAVGVADRLTIWGDVLAAPKAGGVARRATTTR